MSSSLVPQVQKDDLKFIQSYLKNSPYKNLLKIWGGEDIELTYTVLKGMEAQDKNSISGYPSYADKMAYAAAFALKRDFMSRYACRLALKKAALDKKLFFDALVVDRMSVGK